MNTKETKIMSVELTLSDGRTVSLGLDRITANDVFFPWGRFNPHRVCLWVIGNELGPLGAVWAGCESDALDELVDAGLGDSLLLDDPAEEDDDSHCLGNAGEPADLTHAWMGNVDLEKSLTPQLAVLFERCQTTHGARVLADV